MRTRDAARAAVAFVERIDIFHDPSAAAFQIAAAIGPDRHAAPRVLRNPRRRHVEFFGEFTLGDDHKLAPGLSLKKVLRLSGSRARAPPGLTLPRQTRLKAPSPSSLSLSFVEVLKACLASLASRVASRASDKLWR